MTNLITVTGRQVATWLARAGISIEATADATGVGRLEIAAMLLDERPPSPALFVFAFLLARARKADRAAVIECLNGIERSAEIWRGVPGCGLYEVSNLGHVRRCHAAHGHQAGHLLKPRRSRTGHLSVSVYRDDGSQWRAGVHRLVALTFIGEPPSPAHLVCHKNGYGEDCRATNLYWGTGEENQDDRAAHRARGKPQFAWTSDPYEFRARRVEQTWKGARCEKKSNNFNAGGTPSHGRGRRFNPYSAHHARL